jgi:hypothetical protein
MDSMEIIDVLNEQFLDSIFVVPSELPPGGIKEGYLYLQSNNDWLQCSVESWNSEVPEWHYVERQNRYFISGNGLRKSISNLFIKVALWISGINEKDV